jgi:hypothetical protein
MLLALGIEEKDHEWPFYNGGERGSYIRIYNFLKKNGNLFRDSSQLGRN